jgi:hypothetical protein
MSRRARCQLINRGYDATVGCIEDAVVEDVPGVEVINYLLECLGVA